MPAVSDVSLGFRSAYLDHDRLTAQLRAWSEAFPALCRVTSLGKTTEAKTLLKAVWIPGQVVVKGSREGMLAVWLSAGSGADLPSPRSS
jgi:hypothetical protein